MEKLKILVVEDMLLEAAQMESALKKAGYEQIACATGKDSALAAAQQLEPDLVVMDIGLADGPDGIETALELRKLLQHPFHLLFLTDHSGEEVRKRSLAAFPSNYLLKPFNSMQLLAAIDLAIGNPNISPPGKISDVFLLRDKSAHIKVRLEEICYIEAARAYCSMILTKNRKLTFSMSMKEMMERISHPDLVRIHRSHVVNVNHIDEWDGHMLKVAGQHLPVAESYRSHLFSRFRVVP